MALDASAGFAGHGAPPARFLARLVEVAAEHLDDVPFDVAARLAEVTPAAGTAIAARMVPAPALALERVEDFAGTLGEFSALLACSTDP